MDSQDLTLKVEFFLQFNPNASLTNAADRLTNIHLLGFEEVISPSFPFAASESPSRTRFKLPTEFYRQATQR